MKIILRENITTTEANKMIKNVIEVEENSRHFIIS